jgi:hypothetical protein
MAVGVRVVGLENEKCNCMVWSNSTLALFS